MDIHTCKVHMSSRVLKPLL